MRKLLLAALVGLSVAACQTPQQSVGTASGVVAGAVVTAPGGPLDPGYCYVTDRRGRILVDRRGNPRVRRC